MELVFEHTEDIGNGAYPDVVQYSNTQAQLFNIKSGTLYGTPTNRIDNGDWETAVFQSELDVSPDTTMSNLELKVLQGWGIVGGYKDGDSHKMLIYEFAFETDSYLNSGTIKHSLDNPISEFSLTLNDPVFENPEYTVNLDLGDNNDLISPSSKVLFNYIPKGSDVGRNMGTFYIDKAEFTTSTVLGRSEGQNTIGKYLQNQTLNDNNEIPFQTLTKSFEELLEKAKIEQGEYLVENTSLTNWFEFKPNTTFLLAIEEMLKLTTEWRIRERYNGTIVIGTHQFFGSIEEYAFERGKDVRSTRVSRDDKDSYNKVCVHTNDFSINVIAEVSNYNNWNILENKTLYVQVADGTTLANAQTYASEIAERLESVGKTEEFQGRFTPNLQVGYMATVIGDDDSEFVGLITDITHEFGETGYYTNFTLDGGGIAGKGRFSDYINRLSSDLGIVTIGYTQP